MTPPSGLAGARHKIGTTAMNRLRVGYLFEVRDGAVHTATLTGNNVTRSGLGALVAGYAVQEGDRVLLGGQTIAAEDGIYKVRSGDWTLEPDSQPGTVMVNKIYRVVYGANLGARYVNGTVGTDLMVNVGTLSLTQTCNYSDEFSLVTDTLNTTTDKIFVQINAESEASLITRVGQTAGSGLYGVCIFKNDLSVSGPLVVTGGLADRLITMVIDSTTLTARSGLDTSKGRPLSVSYTYSTTAPSQTTAFKNFDYRVIAIGAKGGYSKPSDPAHVINDLSASWATNRITWNPVSGAVKYQVFRSDSGDIFKLIGTTETTQFQDANIAGGESILEAIPGSSFASIGNYPSAVCFHQQRLIFAGSDKEPMTLWFSRSGDKFNFQKHIPQQADDAIKVTIAAGEVNQIRHLVSHQALIVLTANAEWSLTGSAGVEDAVTATSISIRQQSKNGCASARPEITSSGLVHIQNGGQALRNLTWSLEAEAFTGSEISLLARHLLEESPLQEIAYAKRPDGILWGRRADGRLTAATLLEEQKVNAWSLCDFATGPIVAICTIPEDGKDSLYLITASNVGGQFPYNNRYLRLSQRNGNTADLIFLDGVTRFDALSTVLEGGNRIAISDAAAGEWLLKVKTAFSVGNVLRIQGIEGYEIPSDIGDKLVSGINNLWLKVTAIGNDGIGDTMTVTGYNNDTATTYALPSIATFTPYRSGGSVYASRSSFFGGGAKIAFIADGVDKGDIPTNANHAWNPASLRWNRGYTGYRYQSLLETLPGDAARPEGAKAASPQLQLRLADTAGIEIRPAYAFAPWSGFLPRNASSTPIDAKNLFSGVGNITQAATWEAGSAVQIRQRQPLPFTLLSITQENQNGR